MKKASILEYENNFTKKGYDFVIGIDEAGRGPLAGPVVACAAVFKLASASRENKGKASRKIWNYESFNLIRDSKLLSEKQREELYNFILEYFYVGIGICDHKTVDRINILEATYLAMKLAVSQLKSKLQRKNKKFGNSICKIQNAKCIILVDGNKTIPNLSISQKAIIGGDKIVKSISAASIIAKVTRDRIMREMHEKYPEYDFKKHKGYGTKKHREMIKKHGFCEIHRKSFRVK